MLIDYWADYYYRNPKAQEEVEDDEFDMEQVLSQFEAEAEARAAEIPDDPDDWEDVQCQ